MIPGVIEGATRHLGAPVGWDEAKEGHCGVLPILDVVEGPEGAQTRRMVSAWEPTQAEISALAAGGSVHLSIVGVIHPPVWLDVATPWPAWRPVQGPTLVELMALLESLYSPRDVVTWMGTRHPLLQGQIPLAMVMKGELGKVLDFVRLLVAAKETAGG
jgi:hypothetical protein